MTMRSYGELKYSGDNWLGEIPSHWEVLPLKHMAEVDNSGAYGRDPEEGENILPVATTAQIDSGGRFVTSKMSLRSFSNEEVRRYGCTPGNILIVKSSGSADNIISGKAGIVREDTPTFVFSNFLMRLRCKTSRCLDSYLYSLIVSHVTRERVKQMCSTTTYPNLQVPLYVGAKLPCPPIDEQVRIIRFLDHETAKIDALIREQERLIELLQEKRQAVISHAVTKGLDPDVPMKDSGVEWLGEVPVHWEIKKLGYITLEKCDGPFGSAIKSEHYSEQGVRVVRLQNIRSGTFDDTDSAYLDKAYYDTKIGRSDVISGDLLIAGLGDDKNYVGRACVAPDDIEPAMVKADCFRFRLVPSAANPEFVALQLSCGAEFDAGKLSTGSTRQRIPLLTMVTRKCALPPFEEQGKIVQKIRNLNSSLGRLLSEAKGSVELLQERRSSLISAAVTGKIDVRDWKPPIDESAFDEEVRQAGLEATA